MAGMLALAAATPAGAAEKYTVREGDTLASIAERADLDTWRPIYRANEEIDDPDLIYPGSTLTIPEPGSSPPPRDDARTAGGDAAAGSGAGGTGSADSESPAGNGSSAQTGSGDSEVQDTVEGNGSGQATSEETAAQAPEAGSGGVWDELAACESGGDWDHDGTYNGGLQFAPETWDAHGGEQYAPSADEATRAEQIAVAESVRASQGWDAWPACSAELGLD